MGIHTTTHVSSVPPPPSHTAMGASAITPSRGSSAVLPPGHDIYGRLDEYFVDVMRELLLAAPLDDTALVHCLVPGFIKLHRALSATSPARSPSNCLLRPLPLALAPRLSFPASCVFVARNSQLALHPPSIASCCLSPSRLPGACLPPLSACFLPLVFTTMTLAPRLPIC